MVPRSLQFIHLQCTRVPIPTASLFDIRKKLLVSIFSLLVKKKGWAGK